MSSKDQTHSHTKPSGKILPWLLLGPLVTFAGIVSYFLVFARFPTLRDIPWLNTPIAILGLLLSLLAVVRAFKGRRLALRLFSGLGLAFSLGFTTLFLFYITSLSYQIPERSDTTTALATLPNFSAANQEGKTVSLTSLAGKNVVMVFYRGFW